jgi:hypothetical protein
MQGQAAAVLAQQQQIRHDLAESKVKCEEIAVGGPPTREAFDRVRDCNVRLAGFARADFSAVRENSCEIERLISACSEQVVALRDDKKLIRSRIDIGHTLLAFLDRIEERLARPLRSADP